MSDLVWTNLLDSMQSYSDVYVELNESLYKFITYRNKEEITDDKLSGISIFAMCGSRERYSVSEVSYYLLVLTFSVTS